MNLDDAMQGSEFLRKFFELNAKITEAKARQVQLEVENKRLKALDPERTTEAAQKALQRYKDGGKHLAQLKAEMAEVSPYVNEWMFNRLAKADRHTLFRFALLSLNKDGAAETYQRFKAAKASAEAAEKKVESESLAKMMRTNYNRFAGEEI